MKFNFKKISAVLTSGLMVLSGVGFAFAANFPAPFSDGAATGTAIVSGASSTLDAAAVTSINEYLKTKVAADSSSAPTGESFKIEKPSTKLNVAKGISDVWGSAVTKSDLPTLLADGVYRNKNNDEYKYTQKMDLGNITFAHFNDVDYNNNKPDLGFKLAGNTYILNYTLSFSTQPEAAQPTSTRLVDFENRNINIMGKTYYILSFTNGTTPKMTLLDSAVSDQLSEAETKTLVVSGKSYEVSLDFISSDQVKFRVKKPDGTEIVTEVLTTTANTYNLGDGTYIGVRDILVQNYQTGSKMVTFSLGKGKLEIASNTDTSGNPTSGGAVKINDKTITDITGFITFSNGAKMKWSKLAIQWKIDDKKFLTANKELVMPGFEAIKYTMAETTIPFKEKTSVYGGNSYAQLKTTIKDGDVTIPFLYINDSVGMIGNITGIGRSTTERLATSNGTTLQFYYLKNDAAQDRGFVASWNNGRDSESYYLKFNNIQNVSDAALTQAEQTDVYNIITESTVCSSLYKTQTCNLGSITLTIDNIFWNSTTKYVNVSINSGGSFSTLYTAKGLKVYLPYDSWNNTDYINVTTKGAISMQQALVTSAMWIDGNHNGRWTMWFGEQDQYGNLDNKAFNFSIDGLAGTSSSRKTAVMNVDLFGATLRETVQSSKIWEAYMAYPLATKATWDKTDSNSAYSSDLEYHGGEVYANVFVTGQTSSMGEVGNMVFKDSEKDSWKDRNVVLVGGSCINSATADVLGGTYCDAEFTSNTGVGPNQFLIASYADKFSTGKIALVVAGYETAETLAAVNNLQVGTYDTTADKKYVGTVGQGGVITVA